MPVVIKYQTKINQKKIQQIGLSGYFVVFRFIVFNETI